MINCTTKFSSLPLVGSFFTSDEAVGAQIDSWNIADKNGFVNGVVKGTFICGPISQPFDIPISYTLEGETGMEMSSSSDGSSMAAMVWVPVQRSFGPLNIEKIGFGVGREPDYLSIEFDATVSVKALTIGLTDFGLKYSIDPSAPDGDPQLSMIWPSGLAIQIKAGELDIMGVFTRQEGAGGFYDYVGMLGFQEGEVGLTLLGGYSKFKLKKKTAEGNSMFIFGMFDGPIGGPEFAFVNGIAGGIGYNRSINYPPLSELSTFPLIEGAAPGGEKLFKDFKPGDGDKVSSLSNVLDKLGDASPVTPGEFWMAAGVRFTSFQLLDTFLLLNVQYGAELVFGLLGQSTVTIPPPNPEDGGDALETEEQPDPVLFAQIEIEAEYNVTLGFLKIGAQLAPSSYFLNKDCVLTGGFALSKWFKDQGPGNANAGEFVLTFGGYNPHFKAPSYYPTVPRLGYSWQDGDVGIKGQAYLALLPSTLMFGGDLTCTWRSGDLSAWFSMSADFVMGWKPFYYTANLGLTIGVSYQLHLLFVTATISVHIGVNAAIVGPPFSGTLTIDLDIVSFSISFGPGATKKPLTWEQFKGSFLAQEQHGDTQAEMALAAATDPTTPPASVVKVSPTGGLLKTNTDGSWVLDPNLAEFTTHTFYPCSVISAGNQNPNVTVTASGTTVAAPDPVTEPFLVDNILPMDMTDYNSGHTVTISPVGGSETIDVEYDYVLGAVPKSLWNTTDPGLDHETTLPNAIVGVKITGIKKGQHATLPVPTKHLLVGAPPVTNFAWSTGTAPHPDKWDATFPTAAKKIGAITGSITNATVATARSKVLTDLATVLPTSTTVTVSKLATASDLEYLDTPEIGPVVSNEATPTN